MARILIVDDEMLIALSVSLVLEDAGHEVSMASNGVAGLQEAMTLAPDLILTDYMMPRMDGLEMISSLRQNGKEMPIILATAVPEGSLPSKASPAYDAFLSKPYNEKPLLEMINRLLRKGSEPT